jgi:hypothetical protein
VAAGDCGRLVCNTHSAPFGVAAFCGRRVCVRVRAHGIHRVCCRWLTVIRSVVSENCVSLENIFSSSLALSSTDGLSAHASPDTARQREDARPEGEGVKDLVGRLSTMADAA